MEFITNCILLINAQNPYFSFQNGLKLSLVEDPIVKKLKSEGKIPTTLKKKCLFVVLSFKLDYILSKKRTFLSFAFLKDSQTGE